MVRPIVSEDNLQSLDAVPIEDLRAEFVQQAFDLKTKVLQGMKFKQINDQQMDGSMWAQMVG